MRRGIVLYQDAVLKRLLDGPSIQFIDYQAGDRVPGPENACTLWVPAISARLLTNERLLGFAVHTSPVLNRVVGLWYADCRRLTATAPSFF